jgi:STAS-like domain of unknown function (DUF4325)
MDRPPNTSQEDNGGQDKVHMTQTIVKLPAGVGGFAEDKDEAKRIRNDTLLPALEKDKYVILDFSEMKYSTQSFIHALLGAVLQKYREAALQKLEFKNCAPQIKSLIQLVVDYSLGGFKESKTGAEQVSKSMPHQERPPARKSQNKIAKRKRVMHENPTTD